MTVPKAAEELLQRLYFFRLILQVASVNMTHCLQNPGFVAFVRMGDLAPSVRPIVESLCGNKYA